jgi:hypothetical protein
MIKAREDVLLNLRKDKYESTMNNKRYLSLASSQDTKFNINLEQYGLAPEIIAQLRRDDYVSKHLTT